MTVNKSSYRDKDIIKANSVYDYLRYRKPANKQELKYWVQAFLGIVMPDKTICDGHSSPLDYLWHTFSCDQREDLLNGDCIVWANRGGGKTQMGAVATLLDCLFKPGCQVRILAGSLDQAGRMYEYLVGFVNDKFTDFVDGRITKQGIKFKNGSYVEVLTQSSKSVRGRHIHKLRCDEVEMFDKDVFEAAQFVTKSTNGIKASLEIMSTMHRPYGLMQEIVDKAKNSATPLFRWSLWEVIEKCLSNDCFQCPLLKDCDSKAQKASGYMKISDAITQMKRSSRSSWECEMLCKRPMRDNVVFPEFSYAEHVRPLEYDKSLPIYRTIDFGYVNPFVCLWLQVENTGKIRVINEYYQKRKTVAENAQKILEYTPCPENEVAMTFCDPAGTQSSDITGSSAVKELRKLGISVRYRRSSIIQGLEEIRKRLKNANGHVDLLIDPACKNLIESFECYHYPEGTQGQGSELPVKDGIYDHAMDALRYFFINRIKNKIKSLKIRY